MLAPLFGREPALNRYYPQEVMKYLLNVPPTEGPASRSRVEQFMAEWRQAGRLGPPSRTEPTGRVGLMQPDLAELMLSILFSERVALS